jgi:hypothetical protein
MDWTARDRSAPRTATRLAGVLRPRSEALPQQLAPRNDGREMPFSHGDDTGHVSNEILIRRCCAAALE